MLCFLQIWIHKNQIKTFLKEHINHPTNQPVQHEQRTMANLVSAFICLSFLKATWWRQMKTKYCNLIIPVRAKNLTFLFMWNDWMNPISQIEENGLTEKHVNVSIKKCNVTFDHKFGIQSSLIFMSNFLSYST